MHPCKDWETYSEAGFAFGHHVPGKWGPLPWLAPKSQKKGLPVVGAYNYITHPTFRPLSLAYDLLDGKGCRRWVPVMTEFGLANEPHDLIGYAAAGGILEAFNVGFEFMVWNLFCAKAWGWPVIKLEQMRCTMAKARASAYPGNLEDLGHVLNLVNQKHAEMGDYLIKTLTVPKNPGQNMKKPPQVAPRYAHVSPRQLSMDEMFREPTTGVGQFDDDIPF